MKKSKIKIVIVGKNPPPYHGTSVWFETLQQAAWGEELEVLFFNNNLHDSLDSLAKFSLKKGLKNLALYRSFSRFIKAEKPDLVLIPVSQTTLGFLKDAFFVRIASKKTKTLVMLHGSDWKNWLESSSSRIKKIVRRTLRKTVGAVVLGEKLRHLFEDFYPPEQIYVISNGIDVSRNVSKPKEHDENTCNLIFLGNLQKSKGIIHLMEVLSMVKSKPYQLTVVGSWVNDQTQEKCMSLIDKHQLPVQFVGPKYGDEKFQLLSQADLFVFLPQSPEGLPLSILEAMAMNLPILAADQGAISACVHDGENGFLVDPNDKQAAADKIDFLISNQELRRKMARASGSIYEAEFTAKKMIANFSTTFKKIITSS